MPRRFVFVLALAVALGVGALGAGTASAGNLPEPVASWFQQQSCSELPGTKIYDDNWDAWRGDSAPDPNDCLTDTVSHTLCVGGSTYTMWFDSVRDTGELPDIISDIRAHGVSVSEGGCASGKPKLGGGPAPVTNVFLCYSKSQTDPGVWPSDEAIDLLAQGYWLPYALPGNVDGATNVGSFHLVCNLTGTQKPTGGFVDDGGGTWSPDYAAMTGLYPAAG